MTQLVSVFLVDGGTGSFVRGESYSLLKTPTGKRVRVTCDT